MPGPLGYKRLTADGDTGFGVVHGFYARETGDTAAMTVTLTDGSGGTVIAGAEIAAGDAETVNLPERGVAVAGSVFVDFAGTGAGEVVVYGT